MLFDKLSLSNAIREKIESFNCNYQNRDSITSEAEIQKICNEIFNDKTINNSDILKVVVSYISNESARLDIYHRLGLDNILLSNASKPHKISDEKDDILRLIEVHGLEESLNKADINKFVEMSKGKRAAVVKFAPTLFAIEMNAHDRGDLLKALSTLPEDNIAEVAQCIQKFGNEMNASDRVWLIEAIAKIPEGKIADVVKFLPPLFTMNIDAWDIQETVILLALLPEGKITDVVKFAPRLFTMEVDSNDIKVILKAVAALPRNEIAEVVECMHNIGGGMNVDHKVEMILACAQLPEDKINDVVKFVPTLYTMKIDVDDIKKILEVLAALSKGQIADVIKFAPTLFPIEMDAWDIKNILKEIVALSGSKIADMVKCMAQISMTIEAVDKIKCIRAFAKIPEDKIAALAKYALPLFTLDMDIDDISYILSEFAKISKSQMECIVKLISLISKEAKALDTVLMIKILTKIPIEELMAEDNLLELVNREITLDEKLNLIKILADVPMDERADAIECLQVYAVRYRIMMKEEMSAKDSVQFLEGIMMIPKAERMFVKSMPIPLYILKNACDINLLVFMYLLPNALRSDQWLINLRDSKTYIVDSLEHKNAVLASLQDKFKSYQLNPDPSIVNLAKYLFDQQEVFGLLPDHPLVNQAIEMIIHNDPQHKNSRIRGFKTLLDLSKQLNPTTAEIDLDILEDCKYFIRKEMNLYEIAEVVGLVQSLQTKSERKSVIDLTKDMIDETMTWKDQAAILHTIASISLEQREDTIRLAKGLFTQEMNGMQKAMILLSLDKGQMGLELIERLKRSPISYETEFESDEKMSEKSEKLVPDLLSNDGLPFVPISSKSIFANTDLVVFKDDFKGVIPLNGIKESELAETETLIKSIMENKTKIRIDSENRKFEKEMQESIITLLTRSIGRKLIRKVIANPHVPLLPIVFGKESAVFSDSYKIVSLSMNNNPTTSLLSENQKMYSSPNFISLGHELIHVSHFPHLRYFKPTSKGMEEYHNLEEQITIMGESENIQLPSSLEEDFSSLAKGERKYPEIFLEKEEDWQAALGTAFDSFDGLNERNLHAAFANLASGFQVRVGHGGKEIRTNIIFSMNPIEEAHQSIDSNIKENYISFLQKLRVAPADIQKFLA